MRTMVGHTTDVARRRGRRSGRLLARAGLWDVSTRKRIRECGHRGVLPAGSVRIRATGVGDARRAGFSGLVTCGSVWACPVCSERILAGRADELAQGFEGWTRAGGSIAFVTLTMRHDKGQSLRLLWDALSYAWGKVTSGKGWGALRARYGVAGYARVVEVTHGANGWHVHVHAALFIQPESGSTAADLGMLGAEMFHPWAAALSRKGLRTPLAGSGGLDVRKMMPGTGDNLGAYFAKSSWDYADAARSAAIEVARGDVKAGRLGNRTPFVILGDFLDTGDAADLALWHQWEDSSAGRRQLTWSQGMRDRLSLAAERTDDELAAEEIGSADDDLVELPAASWRKLREHYLPTLLDVAEDDDTGDRLVRLLQSLRVDFLDVRPLQRN